jgi:hypothetical protein
MKFRIGDIVCSVNGPYDEYEYLEVLDINERNKIRIRDPETGRTEWWKEEFFTLYAGDEEMTG